MKKHISQVIAAILVATMMLCIAPCAMAASTSESEKNDSYATADTISLNGSIQGKIDSSSDIDYYKVTATSNGKLNITFNHSYANSNAGWYVYVYYYTDGSYRELSQATVNVNGSESVSLPTVGAVKNGVYYIKVNKGYYDSTGYKYTIQTSFSSTDYYEKELNNDYNTATGISFNKTYSGVMNNSSDWDLYKITTTSNGKLNIKFNHTYSSKSSGWYVYVYYYTNNSYTQLSQITVSLEDSESISFPTIGAVANGTYYIKVVNGYYNSVGYEYSLQTTFSSTDYYEKELNNDYNKATLISLNKEYGGVMNDSSDWDIYKITPTTTKTIPIIFSHNYNASSSAGWYITIYHYTNGSYKPLKENISVQCNDANYTSEIYSLSAKANNTYYIKVNNGYYKSVGVEYSLTAGTKSATAYTVTYNANGGSVSPSSASVTAGNSTTLPTPTKYATVTYNANGGSNPPSATKANFVCSGWSTSNSASSASYSCGASYKPTANITLYAVWPMKAYTYLSSSKPTRSGYTFLGWATSSSATSAEFNPGTYVSLKADDTLYAVWKKNDTTPKVEYKTISLNYKGTYSIETEGFRASEYISENESVISVDSEGTVRANATGSADVYVYDSNSNLRAVYTFEVEYTWWEWIIIIVLFGWIWY